MPLQLLFGLVGFLSTLTIYYCFVHGKAKKAVSDAQ
jgi:hypothetical protein